MLPFCVATSLQNSAKLPWRSEMVTSILMMRLSLTRALSKTRPSTVVSILPPHNGIITFLPFNSGTRPWRTAANATAPAPSTTAFSNSSSLRIAMDMYSSLTMTVLSTSDLAVWKAVQ